MKDGKPLGLFEGVGVELEYMIVDRDTLDVLPVCDRLLQAQAGAITTDVAFEDISWSNELALHVVELKTTGPVKGLTDLAGPFEAHVARINALLAPMNARLMPTAMHPWMDPHREMRLWPHDYSPIYETMHRIFDCRGHGWANLQSVHLNLPFADDDQFGRLHAAIRLVLPILPALAASSPFMDARATGRLDNRLDNYRVHGARVPSIVGQVIPEPVYRMDEYRETILGRIYRDLAPHDPQGVLRHEFANARGAIARFERQTIEIRVIDVQECPAADLAIAAAVVGALKLLVNETWSDSAAQRKMKTAALAEVLVDAIGDAERTMIRDETYLKLLGWRRGACKAGDLWWHLVEGVDRVLPGELAFCEEALEVLLTRGCAARRILVATGPSPSRGTLRDVYGELCDCLEGGAMFLGKAPATSDHL